MPPLLLLTAFVLAHFWMLYALVGHLKRRTHTVDLDLDRSPLHDRPITADREVWIWNPAAQAHQMSLEATHLDPP